MKKRAKLPVVLQIIFRSIVLAAAGSLAIAYLSPFINPAKFTFPLFFGLYFIPLAVINTLLLIVSLFIRGSSTAWISFIALLPSILLAELFVRWGDIEIKEDGEEVQLCTYNVGLFVQGRERLSRKEALEGIIEMVDERAPDILCFQEYHTTEIASIKREFPQYPYYTYHLFRGRGNSKFGNLTLSRFPIIESGKITFTRSTNLSIWSDIKIGEKIVRVYNTHLESHSISFTALLKRIRENRKLSEEIYSLHDKVALTFKRRSQQVDSLLKHMESTQLPSIICGDFNDTPISYTYRKLSSNRWDTFREAGSGFASTYSLLWPILRIDFILTPKEMWCRQHTTLKLNYSDHYPVISHLIFP
ncbi:MAG: endonuclease/exonuclease/phosphatase family protein [Bacteroidales bacterium]